MSAAFITCINGSVARGVISREQGDAILDRYRRETEAAGGDGMAGKERAAAGFKAEALERTRREGLATSAAQRIAADVRGYRDAAGRPDVVSAITRLFENVGHTGYSSVRGRYNAILGAATSEIEEFLHATRRSFLTLRKRTEVDPADLVRAAFGEQASDAAQAFYLGWLNQAEKLRAKFNAAGGAIGWRQDWGLPTWHDSGALLQAGFERWRDFIAPRLDWDKMTHAVTETPIAEGERDEVLRHVWESVVMDGWNTREPSRGGSGRASLANSRQDARFLKFRDAEAWGDYNRQFGRGNVTDVMMGHLNGMAKDVASMQVLGPNPAATVQWLKQIIAQEKAKKTAGLPSLYAGRTGPASLPRPDAVVDSLYEISRGSGLPENVITQGYNVMANLQSAAKLGSAIFVHAAINPLIEANARAHYGLPVAGLVRDVLRSLSGSSRREVARMGLTAGDAMHSLERGAREQAAFARMTETSRWLPAITTHYSGLESGVAALRRAWWWAASGEVTKLLDRDFAAIPDRQKVLLEGFGINEADWENMRAAPLYEPDQGASFVRWKEVAGTGRPGAEASAMKYLEMLHQSMEFAVPSSRWRSRAALTLGTREGTMANLLAKSFAMFKGFVGSATISHIEALRHELAGSKAVGAAAAGANLIALTALGTMVLQLKQMSTGKDPLPMDPASEAGRQTILHGMMTSGAMSVFGDFLASDRSSYGHGPLETLAGPVVTGLIDLYGLGRGGFEKATSTPRHPVPAGKAWTDTIAGARQLMQNNTPLLSTHWALRAAYNRILLDQLQFMMDPNAHRQLRDKESKLFKSTGQRYFWPSGSMLPDRPPQLSAPPH